MNFPCVPWKTKADLASLDYAETKTNVYRILSFNKTCLYAKINELSFSFKPINLISIIGKFIFFLKETLYIY